MTISHKELANQNPWWENRNVIDEDFKLRQYDESQLQYSHPMVLRNYTPYSLFTIRGPRQIGKSTALKLLIRNLLSHHQDPRSIFFFDCEMLFTAIEIKETIEAYFAFLDLIEYKGNNFILLDEITSVADWTKMLKFLIDRGKFQNSVVFLTGSNAIDLQKGADRLPGRKGEGKDIFMLPVSFREYVRLREPKLFQKMENYLFGSFVPLEIYQKSKSLIYDFVEKVSSRRF